LFGDYPLANNRSRIMTSKILTGAAAFTLATTAGLLTSAPASAQNWQGSRGDVAIRAGDVVPGVVGGALATATLPFWATSYYGYYDGYYPGYVYAPGYSYSPSYAYTPGYIYAPLYGYYGANDWGPWRYRGGPHPR
jgi:hypothetical protein